MRKLLAAIFAVLGMLSNAGVTATTPPNVLVVGQIAEPKSLDPHAVTALNDFRIIMNLYEGLVRYTPGTLEIEPLLAESWVISDDGLRYRFRLRPGVRFHDGTPFDAAAVKFNFQRMLEEAHPYHDTGPFPLAFFFSSIDRIDVVDSLTVEFVLTEPYAPFLSNLAYPTGLMVSPAAVKRYGKAFGRHPAGTGAFRFAEWQPNAKVVLVRNPDYRAEYRTDAAPLEAVIYRPIADANTRMAEMLSGGLDVMVEVPPDSLQRFRRDARFTVHEQAGPHLWFLILNTRQGPFADKRIRQAANYAVNKRALVENILQGSAEIAAGPVPPAFAWAYENSLVPYPYDPQKAQALLDEAGYQGQELTFYVTQGGSGMLDPVTMGTAIQADLRAVGMPVRIESYEWNSYLGRVNAGLEGKADLAEMAWMTNDPDTLPYLTLRGAAFPEQGGFNSGYYANPEVDRLLARARRSTDRAERARLYKQMQVIVQEDAPWLFVAHWKQNAVTSVRVKNFQLQPSFFLLLQRAAKP
ncbi:ABC transporter substrate-binding protein [Sedimenticola hydrogenitrophicus]|uniref:ABC transporter substrate-binding protein n=1 Tax=Sedimenticola hydrogenitrophicus TaxID=2967975 RepID=UPI0023AE88F6|nr:ABC transporter substrate-binding protein [Sedimenticola hydrogenitrophicus]